MLRNMQVVTLEEHYWDSELAATFPPGENSSHVAGLLTDLDDTRLSAMDAAGIDVQILSHGAPAAQKLASDGAVELTMRVNDRLAEACARHPGRLAAFAALPTTDPERAARELARCVQDLGFKGAMIHGLTQGRFIDERRFWPIFAAAEALDVPIYLHPSAPHPDVTRAYYDDYAKEFPTVIRPAWGFTVETATAAIRLILSRVFEAHPRLKIVLGHMGEALPFLLWRINQALSRPGQEPLNFRDVFRRHFYVTTSGNFSTPALLCTMLELGIDRIMFSVDYPFVDNRDGIEWVERLPLPDEDIAKLLGGTATRLLKL